MYSKSNVVVIRTVRYRYACFERLITMFCNNLQDGTNKQNTRLKILVYRMNSSRCANLVTSCCPDT